MKIKSLILLLPFLMLPVGCSSNETTNVADGASQSEIDRYNEMIEEEARRVSEEPEAKDI